MGSGRSYSMREIAETRAAGRDDDFEEFLDRIESAGGEIKKDEEVPFYDDIGAQEIELGTERIIEFNLNKTDFHLIRRVETHRLEGAGRHKSAIKNDMPRIKMILKKRPETGDNWQIVDLDDMF